MGLAKMILKPPTVYNSKPICGNNLITCSNKPQSIVYTKVQGVRTMTLLLKRGTLQKISLCSAIDVNQLVPVIFISIEKEIIFIASHRDPQ